MLSTVHLHQCFSCWGNFDVSWLSNCFRWKPAGNPVVKTLVSGEDFPDQHTHWFYSAMNSARIKEPLGRSLARRSLRFIYQIVKIEVRQKLGNWPNVAIPNPSKLDLTGCLVVPFVSRLRVPTPWIGAGIRFPRKYAMAWDLISILHAGIIGIATISTTPITITIHYGTLFELNSPI